MPNYRTSLPRQQAHQGFKILRTPAVQPLTGICTSAGLLVCETHYWHGRTTPCERVVAPDGSTLDDSMCSACQNKQSYRDHVYVAVFNPKTPQHFLFECTTHAAKPFEEHIAAHGTLRGCNFQAIRPNKTPNGRVEIVTSNATLTKILLPAAPNVELALAVIWRLPLTGFALTDERPHKRSARPRADGFAEMRNQPDNQPDPQTVGEILAAASPAPNGRSK